MEVTEIMKIQAQKNVVIPLYIVIDKS